MPPTEAFSAAPGQHGSDLPAPIRCQACRHVALRGSWQIQLLSPPWLPFLRVGSGHAHVSAVRAVGVHRRLFHRRPRMGHVTGVFRCAVGGVVKACLIGEPELEFRARDRHGDPATMSPCTALLTRTPGRAS